MRSVILYIVRWSPMLVALCGCQQVLGLGDPAPLAPDASPTTGRFYEIEFRNNEAHEPTRSELGYPALTGAQIAADGTRIPLDIAADGTFTFTPVSSPYHLTFDTPVRSDVIATTPTLDVGSRTTGRRDAVVAATGTRLTLQIAGATTTGYNFVQTSGVWTSIAGPATMNQQFTLDWTGNYLLDAMAYDRTYVTVLDRDATSVHLTRMCTFDLTLQQAKPTVASCNTVPTALDRCIHVVADTGPDLTRMTTALGSPAFPDTQSAWQVFARAGEFGAPGLLLAFSAYTMPEQYDVTTMYTNPFSGYQLTAELVAGLSRDVIVNNRKHTLIAMTQRFVEPGADCNVATKFTAEVAFPTAPALDGIALAQDDVAITLDRSRPIRLSWNAAVPGQADAYQVQLIDLEVADVPKLVVTTTVTDISIDPSVFEAGHHYIVRLQVAVGFPHADSGDLTTTELPYSTTFRDSGVFVIQ